MTTGGEARVVFNVVWTGTVFDHLEPFVASQLAHSSARFRFVANACPPEQIDAMERFALAHPGRVEEVLVVSTDRMIRHGDSLDAVVRARDDGEYFAFIDPDILARGPFLSFFCDLLADHDVVTSGKEVWSEHNVRPADHPGVNGEYFFDQDGYVFGSPHFAIYRRAPLLATLDRWGVGFSSAGNDLPEATRDAVIASGRGYWIYDTAKLVNILLQIDGASIVHEEHPALVHIGSISLYLAPPSSVPGVEEKVWGEDWVENEEMATKLAVAQYTAAVLRELQHGGTPPPVPNGASDDLRPRLELVREALTELLAAHGPAARGIGRR